MFGWRQRAFRKLRSTGALLRHPHAMQLCVGRMLLLSGVAEVSLQLLDQCDPNKMASAGRCNPATRRRRVRQLPLPAWTAGQHYTAASKARSFALCSHSASTSAHPSKARSPCRTAP